MSARIYFLIDKRLNETFGTCLPIRKVFTEAKQKHNTIVRPRYVQNLKVEFYGRPRNENGRSPIHYNNISVIHFERS